MIGVPTGAGVSVSREKDRNVCWKVDHVPHVGRLWRQYARPDLIFEFLDDVLVGYIQRSVLRRHLHLAEKSAALNMLLRSLVAVHARQKCVIDRQLVHIAAVGEVGSDIPGRPTRLSDRHLVPTL